MYSLGWVSKTPAGSLHICICLQKESSIRSLMEEIVSKCRMLFAELRDMATDCVLWMQWLHFEHVYRSAASYEICLIVRRVRKIAKSGVLASSIRLSILLFVRMEQFGYHWTDFHEILNLSVFRKFNKKFQVLLKYVYDKNNGYFTRRPIYIFYHISLSSSWNEKHCGQKSYRKSKHKSCSVTFFENCAVREIMWKSIVDPCWPQMTIWHMRTVCWMLKTAHTQNMQ